MSHEQTDPTQPAARRCCIEAEYIKRALSAIQRQQLSSYSASIWQTYLMEVGEDFDRVRFVATNGESYTAATVPAQVPAVSKGNFGRLRVAVPAEVLRDYTKAAPDVPLTFEETDRKTGGSYSYQPQRELSIRGGKSEFMIYSYAGEDFPALPVFDLKEAARVEIAADTFAALMAQVIPFAGKPSHYGEAFAGVTLRTFGGSFITAAATDGRKSTTRQETARAIYQGDTFAHFEKTAAVNIPIQAAKQIQAAANERGKGAGGLISLYIAPDAVLFEIDGEALQIGAKALPPVQSLTGEDRFKRTAAVYVDAGELEGTLKRLKGIKDAKAVELRSVEGGTLIISAFGSIDYETGHAMQAVEDLPVPHGLAEDLPTVFDTIAVPVAELLNALKAIDKKAKKDGAKVLIQIGEISGTPERVQAARVEGATIIQELTTHAQRFEKWEADKAQREADAAADAAELAEFVEAIDAHAIAATVRAQIEEDLRGDVFLNANAIRFAELIRAHAPAEKFESKRATRAAYITVPEDLRAAKIGEVVYQLWHEGVVIGEAQGTSYNSFEKWTVRSDFENKAFTATERARREEVRATVDAFLIEEVKRCGEGIQDAARKHLDRKREGLEPAYRSYTRITPAQLKSAQERANRAIERAIQAAEAKFPDESTQPAQAVEAVEVPAAPQGKRFYNVTRAGINPQAEEWREIGARFDTREEAEQGAAHLRNVGYEVLTEEEPPTPAQRVEDEIARRQAPEVPAPRIGHKKPPKGATKDPGKNRELIARAAHALGRPTRGGFAENLWRLCSGRAGLAEIESIRLYEAAGYIPFAGFPLERDEDGPRLSAEDRVEEIARNPYAKEFAADNAADCEPPFEIEPPRYFIPTATPLEGQEFVYCDDARTGLIIYPDEPELFKPEPPGNKPKLNEDGEFAHFGYNAGGYTLHTIRQLHGGDILRVVSHTSDRKGEETYIEVNRQQWRDYLHDDGDALPPLPMQEGYIQAAQPQAQQCEREEPMFDDEEDEGLTPEEEAMFGEMARAFQEHKIREGLTRESEEFHLAYSKASEEGLSPEEATEAALRAVGLLISQDAATGFVPPGFEELRPVPAHFGGYTRAVIDRVCAPFKYTLAEFGSLARHLKAHIGGELFVVYSTRQRDNSAHLIPAEITDVKLTAEDFAHLGVDTTFAEGYVPSYARARVAEALSRRARRSKIIDSTKQPYTFTDREFDRLPPDAVQWVRVEGGRLWPHLHSATAMFEAKPLYTPIIVVCDGDERAKDLYRDSVRLSLTIIEGFDSQRAAAVDFLDKVEGHLRPYSYERTREVGGMIFTERYTQSGYLVATNDPTGAAPTFDPDFWKPTSVESHLKAVGLSAYTVDENTDFSKPPFTPDNDDERVRILREAAHHEANANGHGALIWDSLCVARCRECNKWIRALFGEGPKIEVSGPAFDERCPKAGDTQ